MTVYSREDAKMTHGFAILCMCMLHLFCRVGDGVLGKPLIWISQEKPLVYWLGFFAEVCVPMYTICAGYARQLKKKSSYQDNLKRIFQLLKIYWISVIIFSVAGLWKGGTMPGDWKTFIQALLLLKHYNGAQWYLNTYVIMLLIPAEVILFPVKRLKTSTGLAGCFALQIAWYAIQKMGLMPGAPDAAVWNFFYTELTNLIGVLPYYWMGAFICKGNLMERCENRMRQYVSQKNRNKMVLLAGVLIFLMYNLLHKAVLVGIVSLSVFVLFNLYQKGSRSRAFWKFMGKHSTNIWLTHMFFYCADPFNGLVQRAKYPLCMLVFMLLLCIASSYIIMSITKGIDQIQRGVFH